MAHTQIADLIVPGPFTDYMFEQTAQTAKIFLSGIVRRNSLLQDKFSGGGSIVTIPFMKPVADTAANASSDNVGTAATPAKLNAASQKAARLDRNYAWAQADLAAMLAGVDPLGSLIANLGNQGEGLVRYWNNRLQDSMVSILKGITADNIANDSADMVATIGATTSAGTHTPTAADRISPEALVLAEGTMGDADAPLDVLVCHPIVGNQIKLQNLAREVISSANFSRDMTLATQRLQWSQYLQKLVIVDERCPTIADGTNATMYTSYLLGAGFFSYAEMIPKVPLASQREELDANGAGSETIVSRRAYCFHPMGFSFVGSPAGDTPTEAELATATTWNRVYERKNIPLAIIRTNG